MKKYILLNLLFIFCLTAPIAYAQQASDSGSIKKQLEPIRKFYVGTAMDAGLFSSATIQKPGTPVLNPGGAGYTYPTSNTLGTLRFSYLINFGFTFNFNLERHFGIYTGIDIKNIGFIEKSSSGVTIKRRTYNIGAPIGIKIGNMAAKGSYLFFGGGIDVPINYKEKYFVVRNEKSKYNEWFSSATPATMPYLFAGFDVHNMASVKLQYYPGNFLNPNYVTNNNFPSNTGYNVHLMVVSLGLPMPLGKHKDMVKKHVADLNTATM